MEVRDRQEGWVHAKLSGHRNEDLVTSYVRNYPNVQEALIEVAKKSGEVRDCGIIGKMRRLTPEKRAE